MLRVVVESASKLPKSSFRTPDPITTVYFKDEKKKTKSINSNLNPVWNEVLEFDLKGLPLDSSSFITVTVKDFETIGKDKFIGSTKIFLKDLASGQVKTLPSKNLALLNEKSQPIGGTIDLVIAYEPPASALPNPNDPTANSQDAGDTAGDGDEGDEDHVYGGGGGGVPESPSAGQPGNQLQKRLGRNKKNRRILSNKPQDFQIRIRVIEGRQLPGNNIKPVVKVNVCGQTHRTRIRGGNNPFFDEIFFYNVNMLPSDLFDENISIRVYDSYSLRADSLMGEFKLDVGYVYDEPGHTVMRKWLLLNDPDNSSSGAKGYLKVSMFIVGTGDEPPVENRDTSGDQDDVESNLLLPAGVSLRWVTFMLKLYRAEDIPQMDDAFVQSVKEMFGAESNKKNLVDPFVEVCFAGKKICSKIIEKTANPDWNQVINLQIKFPSMCDRIRLTVFDWDRLTRNDAVGTTYLNLSKIASSGGELEDSSSGYGASPASEAANTESDVGFLPAFGPCYVNLYGSPREFTGFPDPYEDLNYGKDEGVAYRGRVLVELTTKLDGKVDKKIDDIPNDDILVVEKYQRRRKYSMCAVFHTANMLQDVGEPIQFEVSIGNYGNIFDATCKPLASTTQFSCAVFDGNFYYYMPWSNIKPVVILTSYWEDISHRMDAVNIIQNMTDRLQSHICSLKTALLAKVSDTRLAEIWLKLVNQVIEDLDSNPVPELEGKANLTSLDIQIRKMRVNALKFIKDSAVRMREEATDVKTTLTEIENWLERMTGLIDEPQNSMPDVIIWMLRGEKRVAYARIPAHQIMFSTTSVQACGKYCGKTQTIFMQYPMDKTKGVKVPVQLRVNMWFGLSAHENKFNSFAEGTFSVFTEMYENQAFVFGKWGTTGLVGRHKTSDVTGKIKLKRESFMPPKGWEWEGDWFVDPEKSLLTEADAGHTEFTDEVFQNETRYPGGEWKPAEEPYTDVNGEKAQSPNQIECPPGWKWEEAWSFDINRAVDENGWEYGITIPPDSKPKSWVPAEKMYHIHRRKRMVRPRKKESEASTPSEKMAAPLGDPEGWEYSSLIGWKFHRKQQTTDTFRRRRWRKKMAPSDRLGASAIFKLEGALGTDTSDADEKGKSSESATSMFGANTPMVSCNFDRPFVYHLRVYVYQARNLLALDKDSFSDPYAHVSFLHLSKTTETIPATLNPTWDQTLIFNSVEIYGDPQAVAQNPPNVVFELFDKDQVGKDESLGRSLCPPVVKLNPETGVSPRLLWYPILHGDKKSGDLLVAAELIMKDKPDGSNLPIVPPKRGAKLYMVPQGIRPVVQLTGIEILTWGLRNMKNFQLAAVSSPSLIVEFGGETVQSAVIKNIRKNPNFPGSVLFFKVLLPKEEMYTPPIVIKVIDHRPFGRKPIVGQCTIDSLEVFRCDPYTTRAEVAMSSKVALMAAPRDVAIDMEDRRPLLEAQRDFGLKDAVTVSMMEKETVDWWSKFYASLGEHEKCGPYLQKGYDTLKIFQCELENVPEYKGLTDFCDTFKLYRGRSGEDDEDPSVVGEFKGLFKIYPLSDDPSVPAPPRQFRELPDSGPQECIVRIYIIRAIDLQPKDNNGLCDPYIKIALGKKVVEDRDHYIPNTVNPVFGRMFELTCFIPQEKDLKISVYDYDLMSRDEKVGDTVIDLENRLLSRFGSYCGVPQTYCTSGINQWRDQMKPSQILQNLSRLRGIPPPVSAENGKTLSHAGREYTLDEFEAHKEIHQHLGPPNERLALHVLRTQGLIPEHVESRTLYSSFQPTLSQGTLQMWVDVFPKSLGLPGPPLDITPRKPKKFFLRVIIWNTADVILDETSITGEDMSDIYVKGWMPGMEENKQKTDVHFRSLDGDGNFNWRFVYPFEYLPAEQLCLVSRKEHFWSLDKSEFRTPAKLIVQIWDNDKFSLDDYLGTLELDLNKLTPPAKTPQKCHLDMITDTKGPVSHKSSQDTTCLFTQKSVRGWWPCMSEVDGKLTLTGKVEMTLEIVTEKEAEERPAGKGRDEPNMNPKLDPPNRPETSFLWFTNPCKTMKFIVWRRFKWVFIGIIILILVLFFLGILFYSLPNYISMKIVKPFR
ncbi:myoferlin-like isoform X2 [Acipenser oxyrinchus oxyrinchus]|uniref:Myoferlin-like isoform X2 n=1 Tax=Acipenser oxyrinchus oxyrinchus TaxID=40147 RepID=A0AAD8D992_ACIOX|nr:myoferlin-like isoform X2 [Acipenser oxyrinchus oxyrinchus]